ncbi:hypothetical protein [Clostridium sp. C2-6-12]|uniref:hypothetical protein n=1 Tax=Clostridium sp. C2-6-12 TaxID=2698832 RepID=UPI0019212FAC|nr:hypothetical protein [Clostridium sp. C2-6-12]
MQINWIGLIFTIINIVLYLAILIGIFKGIKEIKNFISRNKELNKKIDIIINKLENKE